MAHNDHDHSQDVDGCHVSGKYSEYIQTHLEDLRAKCDHLLGCINKLLQGESPLVVLKGDNISLNKICGLIYRNGNGVYSNSSDKCSDVEREDIRVDLEGHLKNHIEDASRWKNVRRCLGNSYGDNERTTYVDEICGLARKQTNLCKSFNTHRTVETFFNQQIQHLKCHCQNLDASDGHSHSHVPAGAYIGAGMGGLLLIVILVLAFLCYRHRRRQQKKKKRSPNVIYLPAPDADNHPIYQEVYNDMGPTSTAPNPPTLPPMRYTPHPTTSPRQGAQEEEPAYLEPVEVGSQRRPRLPLPKQANNPGYDLPPKYSERAEDDEALKPQSPGLDDSDIDGGYFQPMPSPPAEGGEDQVEKDKAAGYEAVESVQEDKRLGPVPAKRTKKDDRQAESHYFVLENVRDGEKMGNEHEA
ncbi:uncharacterized protein LOC101850056 isoform X2 [Aplysia californica]|uniref:Uncharacterized protein LOC101850056 isoform X2 n=1 Tax=Aplysia californica TaxID=6500 RepID=A0ABM0KA30_APLCA|nr:uncharacterized protein LOC101850056 isoform X2 [Aplysia californica]